jgi:hypothetical protein
MKSKKLLLPTIVFSVAVLAMVICSFVLCIAKKPTVTEGEFPFTITYELDGEKVTVDEVYKVRYDRNGGYTDTKTRIYVGEIGDMGEGNTVYTLKKDDTGRIELCTNFYPDYLMGDPEYDYFEGEAFEPKIYYYDVEEIEYQDEETLSAHGVKLIGFEYPEPIENSFVFSHLSILNSAIVLPTIIISLLALLVIIIFVKKDKDLVRKPLDIVSIILNFVISFTALPYFSVCAWFLDAMGDNESFFNQIMYFVPALTILSIAASVALRRKGYRKSGFFIQFVGVAVFVLLIAVYFILGLF